jgi:putative membrane protein insertion efficiency factor
VRYAGIAAVYAFRYTIRPFFPAGSCKYYPTCSTYALQALKEYGLLRGSILATWRLLRCNPWSHGGVDHVHDQGLFT